MPPVPRWIILTILLLVVPGRSAVFILFPESYFDSDQAIVGLMAKHLAELRAFPVFLYGQTYMLGVEAWLAAPLFALFGVSGTVLKLPLLAMNVVIAFLLVRTFEREMGLRPAAAALAALPFVLPPVGLAAAFVDASGGSLEPYLYVVLIWVTRRSPLLCGLVFGIGFVNREFTLYALVALACVEALDGRLFTRAGAARAGRLLSVAAGVWIVVQGLKHLSSASGPGTSVADTFTASNNLAELMARTCVSPARALGGVGRLFDVHWPAILGTAPYPLSAFSIESRVGQGLAGSSWLPALIVVLSVVGIAIARRSTPESRLHQGFHLRRGFGAQGPPRFAHYLVLVSLCSIGGYLFGRCGEVNFFAMRYELLSLLGIVGLAGWFLSVAPPRPLQVAWMAAFAAWMLLLTVPHVRLIAEYGRDRPVPAKQELIRALDAAGIRYGKADYWLAYYIDFMTNERMVFAATEPQRILLYNKIVADHAAEAVRLSRRPCDGGLILIPGVYQCPLH
jgi:hypothetical protein